MATEQIKDLIKKYLSGETTLQEKEWVEQYYDTFSQTNGHVSELNTQEKKNLEEKMLNNILNKIGTAQEEKNIVSSPIRFLRYAAVLFGLLVIGAVYKAFLADSKNIFITKAGEIKSIVLPDGSNVLLNGNSSLQYSAWPLNSPRVVILKGEAYFSVKHTSNHDKFIVNIPNKYQVEVLGTEFNISERENNSKVLLNSGKIKLRLESASRTTIVMQPGELVEFDPNKRKFNKSFVNPALHNSWKDKKLVFDNTKLKDIIQILEDTYGFDVKVTQPSLLNQAFSGTVPSEDIEVLLIGLSKSFDLKVHKSGNKIEISK